MEEERSIAGGEPGLKENLGVEGNAGVALRNKFARCPVGAKVFSFLVVAALVVGVGVTESAGRGAALAPDENIIAIISSARGTRITNVHTLGAHLDEVLHHHWVESIGNEAKGKNCDHNGEIVANHCGCER